MAFSSQEVLDELERKRVEQVAADSAKYEADKEKEKNQQYLLRQFDKLKQAQEDNNEDQVKHYRDKIKDNGGDPDDDPNKESSSCCTM